MRLQPMGLPGILVFRSCQAARPGDPVECSTELAKVRDARAEKLASEGTKLPQQPLICSFGYHKCATRWTKGILANVARRLKLRYRAVHSPSQFGGNLEKFVRENRIDILSYNGPDPQYLRQLEDFKGFHVIRDPRDISVSAYFSDLYSHGTARWPELARRRQELKNLSQEEGLALEIRFRKPQFESMLQWDYQQKNVLEMRYEDLTQDPYQQFMRVFEFLGLVRSEPLSSRQLLTYVLETTARERLRVGRWRLLSPPVAPLPVEVLLGILYDNRFDKLAGGRSHGQEDVRSHYRKGVAGDWANYLTRVHLDLLNRECPDLWKLGYWEQPTAASVAADVGGPVAGHAY